MFNSHVSGQSLLKLILLALFLLSSSSCKRAASTFDPEIVYIPTESYINYLPSAFPKITKEEAIQDWSKELRLGLGFIEELDLYRAVTCFKRAKFLISSKYPQRRDQIDFCIMQAYYMGLKYQDALNAFNRSELISVNVDFPAFEELLIMLYDCYQKNDECEKADKLRGVIVDKNYGLADDLVLYEVLSNGDLDSALNLIPSSPKRECLYNFLGDFYGNAKSVKKAQFLNAVLPGAGYYYVGLNRSALTSLLVNTVFIAAAYQFFNHGYTAAGIITTSLECGWYFGGINGAGLAAKEYNERLYETKAKEFMAKEKLFPLLMFNYAF